MPINTKTATAAIALLMGAGIYPNAAMSQTETEEVEVDVIEADEAAQDVEQAAEETGEAIGEAAEETGALIEEGAAETGQALQEGAQETEQAVEGGVQETEQAVEEAEAEVETAGEDLDETQRQELEQAAAEGRPVPPAAMIMGVQKEGQWLSSELIDREVQNQQGETIGDIGGILFSNQGPDGVIVEVGGFLGLGEKDVAIKWQELSVSEDGILVNATEEQLENAPEFLTREEQRLQAEQEAAEAQQQAAQQTETLGTAPAEGTEGMMTEQPAEVEVETVE